MYGGDGTKTNQKSRPRLTSNTITPAQTSRSGTNEAAAAAAAGLRDILGPGGCRGSAGIARSSHNCAVRGEEGVDREEDEEEKEEAASQRRAASQM